MITRDIKYGGTLVIGDFIGVGSNYGMLFGWFIGSGVKNDTTQFISPTEVLKEHNTYVQVMEGVKKKGKILPEKYHKGFTTDLIYKEYVRDVQTRRIIKITDPENIFDFADKERYIRAKKVLQELDFLR